MTEPLEFTGERFTPECVREIRYEHMHRYAFASRRVRGLKVLDAACGEGYGSALLAGAAEHVTGVDLSPESIAHARGRYGSDRLSFEIADCTSLPFPEDSFDCVVSFETIEHVEDQDGLLNQFRRVLRPSGFLLISSPDKAVYSDRLGNRNEYHVRELTRGQFESALGSYFPVVRLWGQRLAFHSAIWPLEGASGVSFTEEQEGKIETRPDPPRDPVYLLALCAASPECIPGELACVDLFSDVAESVYVHYRHEIRKNMAAGGVLAERDREIDSLRRALQAARGPQPGVEPRSWLRRLLGRN